MECTLCVCVCARARLCTHFYVICGIPKHVVVLETVNNIEYFGLCCDNNSVDFSNVLGCIIFNIYIKV